MTEDAPEEFASSSMSNSKKYHGLLKKSARKRLRDHMSSFFDYIFTMAGSHKLLTQTCQVVWLLQLLITGYHPFDFHVWDRTSITALVFNVFSIAVFICPTQENEFVSGICSLIFASLVWVALIFVFVVVAKFARATKVSQKIVEMIVVFVSGLMLCSVTISSAIFGRALVYAIDGKSSVVNGVAAAMVLVSLVTEIAIEVCFVTTCVTFRPQIVHILYFKDSLIFHVSYACYQVLSSVGSYHSGAGGIVCLVISIIPLCVLIYIGSKAYCWASEDFRFRLLLCLSMTLTLTVADPILRLMKLQLSEIAFVAGIIVLLLGIYIRGLVVAFFPDKRRNLLDEIAQDKDRAEALSHDEMMNLLVYGFENGHRVCHSWTLFAIAGRMFPQSRYVAVSYVRYSAIYPDDTEEFLMAANKIRKLKKHNLECKVLLAQVRFILQQRERKYSKALRKTTLRIADKTEKCKTQMRYIWECIMQRKTGELEKLAETLKKNEEEIIREYYQLCLFYPNNTYVVSGFAAFLAEVLGQERKAAEYYQVYRWLKAGARARVERTYFFATKHMPNLPDEKAHAKMSVFEEEEKKPRGHQSMTSSVASMNATREDEPEISEKQSQRRYLESMVESVRLPVTRYGPFVMFVTLCLLVPAISIGLVILHSNIVSEFLSLASVCQHVGQLEIDMNQLSLMVYQYAMSSCGTREQISTIASMCSGNVQETTDKERVLALIQSVQFRLEDIMADFHDIAQIEQFEKPVRYVLAPMVNCRHYVNATTYYTTPYSLQHQIIYMTSIAMRLTTLSGYDVINHADFATFVNNAGPLTYAIHDFSLSVYTSLQMVMQNREKYIEIWSSILLIAGACVGILSFYLLSRRLEKQKKMVFDAFKSLSKSAISAIVSYLSSDANKYHADERQLPMTVQEENTLKTFSMSHEGRSVTEFWSGNFVLSLMLFIFIVAAIVVMSLLIVSIRDIADQLEGMVPIFRNMPVMHIRYCIVTLYLLRAKALEDPKFAAITQDDFEVIFRTTQQIMETALSDFVDFRYGSWGTVGQGIAGIGNGLVADVTKSRTCPAYEDLNGGACVMLNCMSYDNAVSYIWDIVTSLSFSLIDMGAMPNKPLNEVMIWLVELSSAKFVNDSLKTAKDVLDVQVNRTELKTMIIPISIILVIIFIIAWALLYDFISSADTVHWFVHLLLFCDPESVLKSRQHFKILSNDFSDFVIEEQDDTAKFYQKLMEIHMDATIFMENNMVIHTVNRQAVEMFQRKPEEMIGREFHTLFDLDNERVTSLRNFLNAIDNALHGVRSPCISMEIELEINGTTRPVLAALHAVNGNGEIQTKPCLADGITLFTLTLKDISATARTKKQIKEEQEKIDQLLSLVLPHEAVVRRQHGEEAISYYIQSASFLYVDFIGFGRWCSLKSSEEVLKTVESLFKEFDRIIGRYDSLVKLKSLGGDYLIAGGVLDEVNQPRLHAKQTVSAGLDIIAAVDLVNVELGHNISIRTCVYTHGPVVAGVANQVLPTFEVLGTPMVQIKQMLQYAPSMSVLIPDFVCELLFSEHFVIKKGPLAVINDTNRETYIVKGYDK